MYTERFTFIQFFFWLRPSTTLESDVAFARYSEHLERFTLRNS